MSSFFRRRNDKKKVDDSTFLKNGAILLEKLITSRIGKRNPIRSFSAEEIKSATNKYEYEKAIARDGYFRLYKAFLKRPVLVMMFEGSSYREEEFLFCFNNIVFASQVYHKNVLKLIGCCLETKFPILVFESVEYCTLDDWIHRPHQLQLEPLLLRHRLKIAMEIANAVAYLHVGFPRPVVFKDLRPDCILLDEHYVAKLYDFSRSESIPEGETHTKEDLLAGTIGFLAPEYVLTGKCNEKSDVYSFGSLLLVLLTGRHIPDLEYLEQENDLTNADNVKADDSTQADSVVEDDRSNADYVEEDDPTVSGYVAENNYGVSNRILDYLKKYIENNTFNKIADPVIAGEASFPEMQQQLRDLMQLICKCVNKSPEDRPTMIDVAKQLRQMYLSLV